MENLNFRGGCFSRKVQVINIFKEGGKFLLFIYFSRKGQVIKAFILIMYFQGPSKISTFCFKGYFSGTGR